LRADKIPNFVKSEGDLFTDTDKWMYLLKHMSTLDKVPTFLDKRVFQLIFKISEVAKLRKEERMAYEASLKNKWDTQNAFDSVRREALVEGIEQGIEKGAEQKSYEVVSNLLAAGKFTDSEIANFATVSEDFVKKVRADLANKKK